MHKLTFIFALLLAGPLMASDWMPITSGDLRASALLASEAQVPASRHAETQPVSFARPLDIDSSVSLNSGPQTDSREYWVDAKSEQLARGLELPLSSPGAIVRISALNSDARLQLSASSLQVQVDGQSISSDDGKNALRILGSEALNAHGMAVPANTLAFELPDHGQPHTLALQMESIEPGQNMVVHVFEPNSDWTGQLSADRFQYLGGDTITAQAGLSNGRQVLAADEVQAVLVSPDASQAWPLKQDDSGRLLIPSAPGPDASTGEGLWEIHAYLRSKNRDTVIQRDLKLAVNLVAPTARFGPRIDVRNKNGLAIALEVETGVAGRYQASAQLWGTDSKGQLAPLALTESAAMLKPGTGRLVLEVSEQLLSDSGLGAPYELRQVRLADQGRMGLLELRQLGLIIPNGHDSARRKFN